MEAKDIMTKNVITASPDDTVKAVIQLLGKNKISGVPVVDAEKKVVGMITEGDIIFRDQALRPITYFSFLNEVSHQDQPSAFEAVKRLFAEKISKIMVKDVITASCESSLEELSLIMVEKKINRIPIVDENNTLIGIVSRADLVASYIKK